MKRTRQITALLLSLVMITSVLCSCTNNPKENAQSTSSETPSSSAVESTAEIPNLNLEGYPIVNKKITLKMMGAKAGIHGPWEGMAFFKNMEEMTNIHFEFDSPAQDVYQEKKNIAFASGSYPDVFFGGQLTDNDEVTYGENQKILIPLTKLIDQYSPNLSAYLKDNAVVKDAITHQDQNIYAIPQVVEAMWCLTPMNWINEKWCKDLNLSIPKNTDELYTVLKAFKEKDANGNGDANDEIPMTGTTVLNSAVLNAFGLAGKEIEVVDGKVRFNPITENYKAYLEYAHKLYADGLLDNETFTETEQQIKAKGVEMRLGLFSHAAAWLVCPPEKDNDFAALPPLTSPVNDKQVAQMYNKVNRGTFAITSTNKYPEATMRWVDYLFTEQGNTESRYGYENVHWKWLNAEKTSFSKIIPDGMNGEEYRGGQITPDCGTAIPNIADTRMMGLEFNDKPPSTLRLIQQSDLIRPFAKVPFPQTYSTTEQLEKISTLKTDLTTYVTQMEARFITGEDPLTMWDTYTDTLKKMKVEEYVAIYQEIYDGLPSSK